MTKRSIQKVWWQDSFGHEWQARIADRVEGHGCPYCNDGKLLAGFNDLATCFPEIAAEWSEANFPPGPEQVKPKSRRVVWWCCADCGHEWKAVINTRVFSGQSCPACSRELRRHKNAWKYDKDAGAALIAAYKDMKQANKAVSAGEYLGMQMSVSFDSFDRKFTLSLKGKISHSVEVGADPIGNITRIGNALEGMEAKLADAETKLETVKQQLETAKEEVQKPFAQEEELKTKLTRLTELNALLNMDEKGDDVLDVDEDAPKKDERSEDTPEDRGGEDIDDGVGAREDPEEDIPVTADERKTPGPEPVNPRATDGHEIKSLRERLEQKKAVVEARDSFRENLAKLPKAVNQTL